MAALKNDIVGLEVHGNLEDDMKDLQKAFRLFDENNDGTWPRPLSKPRVETVLSQVQST